MSEKPTILIVEDDETLGNLFRQILKVQEYEVTLIQDGLNALAYLKREVPDLILLDLHLPRLSGMDILAELKGDARLAQTKIAVITADIVHGSELESQVDRVLIKPIRYQQLAEVCEQLLGR